MSSPKKTDVKRIRKRGRPKKNSLRHILAEIEEILRKDKKNP